MSSHPWIFRALLGMLCATFVTTAQADPLRVSGTGALLTSVKQLLEPFLREHPDILMQFYFPPVGTSGAIRALTDQQMEIALTGRPLKKEEEAAGLVQYSLGASPFAFVVHRDSPVREVTMQQLVDIYAGRLKTWPDGSRIRVILRPVADADTAILSNISPAMREALAAAHANRQPGSALADTDIDLVEMVEKVPGSVGSVAMTLVLSEKRPLKGLTVDGIAPTTAAMENKEYPHAKPTFVVIRGDASREVRAVVDYLLAPERKKSLMQLGIAPAPR
ncbi:MAG: substrate-binding domain-containing protein [Magnetococcales bacterium]|nr:substrate-binding domain-containing protein [Magnetococcales bacterium]